MRDARWSTDAWRLAAGTLTTVPVRAPGRVTRHTAGVAMLLAPVAGLMLGALAGAVLWAALALETGSLLAGVLAVASLRLGDRALHIDGLADTADGLAASYDRERSLAVMRTGDTGPAGAAAVVLVLLVQVAATAQLADAIGAAVPGGPADLVAGLAVAGCVMVSRSMLIVACMRGVPAVRADGLGAAVVGTVGRLAGVAVLVVVAVVVAVDIAAAAWVTGTGSTVAVPWWSAPVAVGVSVAVTGLVLHRCVRRLGGVTGDVLGAVVEVSLAACLVTVAILSSV